MSQRALLSVQTIIFSKGLYDPERNQEMNQFGF